MTYTQILEYCEKHTNVNLAAVVLMRMMDIVEEETGNWPDWNDKAPQWILDNFGISWPVKEK